MDWFKHDANASRDTKLKKLIMRHGMAGYGLYFYCLELITDKININNLTFAIEDDAEIIADNTKMHQGDVEIIMRYMVELGLFEASDGAITCFKLAKRLNQSMTSNTEFRKKIKAVNHDAVMTVSDSVMTVSDSVMQEEEEELELELELEKEKRKNQAAEGSALSVCDDLIDGLKGSDQPDLHQSPEVFKKPKAVKEAKPNYPAWVISDYHKELFDYRKQIKKPLKTVAGLDGLEKSIMATAVAVRISIDDVIKVLKENEWQTIKPDWVQNSMLPTPKTAADIQYKPPFSRDPVDTKKAW